MHSAINCSRIADRSRGWLNIKTSQTYYKQQYDKNAKLPTYQVGDLILLHDPTAPVGKRKKLKIRWVGPYFVVERTSDCNDVLRHIDTNKKIPILCTPIAYETIS